MVYEFSNNNVEDLEKHPDADTFGSLFAEREITSIDTIVASDDGSEVYAARLLHPTVILAMKPFTYPAVISPRGNSAA